MIKVCGVIKAKNGKNKGEYVRKLSLSLVGKKIK
jgi:hypothetical protein